nr:hypothetical protein CFP56_04336 [Quercus suber]
MVSVGGCRARSFSSKLVVILEGSTMSGGLQIHGSRAQCFGSQANLVPQDIAGQDSRGWWHGSKQNGSHAVRCPNARVSLR